MLARFKQLTNQKLPSDRAIISDIVLWVFLALLFAYGVYLFAVVIPEKRGQTIILRFKDSNEISKGSSVRMMGTDIGFVDDLWIQKDHVKVKLQTYPGQLKIPSGATFTILFTGLAGSKSIEIELPSKPYPKKNGKPVYFVEEPIRMKDTMNSQIAATQALQQGAENIADFFGKKKPVEELQLNIQQTHQASETSLRYLTDFHRDIRLIRQEVIENAQAATGTLNDINQGLHQFVTASEPRRVHLQLSRLMQSTQNFSRMLDLQAAQTTNMVTLSQQLTRANQVNTYLSNRVTTIKQQMVDFPIQHWLDTIQNNQNNVLDALTQTEAFFSSDHLPALKQTRQAIQSFNRTLLQLNIKTKAAPPAAIKQKTRNKRTR